MGLKAVVACLHHDPARVARLHEGDDLGLSAEEAGWLRAVPRAAWGVDPMRARRVAGALIEEFPQTAAIVGRDRVMEFCASAAFLSVCEGEGNLASAFAGWVDAGSTARLEGAMAQARRGGVAVVEVPASVMSAWQARVDGALAERVAHGARLSRPPEEGDGAWVLAESRGGDVSVAELPEALARLVIYGLLGRTREELVEEARRLGAEDDAEVVVDELLELGTVRALARPAGTGASE
ncbi:MAG: hypothetical protein FJ102_23700 [Deltaproteobacteria bacterium]|nr:hypothetical protein [Deltaproteobacteria bacterium]